MECRARSEQQARQPRASSKWNSKAAALACGRKKKEISASPSCFSSCFCCHRGRDGGMCKYRSNPKKAPTANLKQQQRQAFPFSGTVPPPFFLLERQQITLGNWGDIDWQKKYLTADIFKLRCLHVRQVWVCEILHHHSQIFLISYLWILDSQIPFLSWRLFI